MWHIFHPFACSRPTWCLVALEIHGDQLVHELIEGGLAVVCGRHVSILVSHLNQKLPERRHHFFGVLILITEVLLVVLDQALELVKHLVLGYWLPIWLAALAL